jgi:integrase
VPFDGGLPLPVVSARLGHANPAITMSIYAHRIGTDDRGAAVAVEQVFGKKE